jgi:Leucine-rich repeat (LRR) protein
VPVDAEADLGRNYNRAMTAVSATSRDVRSLSRVASERPQVHGSQNSSFGTGNDGRPLRDAATRGTITDAAAAMRRLWESNRDGKIRITELNLSHNRLTALCPEGGDPRNGLERFLESFGALFGYDSRPTANSLFARDAVKKQELLGHGVSEDDGLTMSLLSNVGSLRLNNNRLRGIPNGLAEQPNLTSLDLSGNLLRHVRALHHPRLTELDLSGNRIVSMSSLAECRRLRRLNVAQNQLIFVPMNFRSLHAVRSIDLSQNSLFTLGMLGVNLPPAPPRKAAATGTVLAKDAVSGMARLRKQKMRGKQETNTLVRTWSLVKDPVTGESAYFSAITGEIRRAKPPEMVNSEAEPDHHSEESSTTTIPPDEVSPALHRQRLRLAASDDPSRDTTLFRAKGVWYQCWSDEYSCWYYVDEVGDRSSWEEPEGYVVDESPTEAAVSSGGRFLTFEQVFRSDAADTAICPAPEWSAFEDASMDQHSSDPGDGWEASIAAELRRKHAPPTAGQGWGIDGDQPPRDATYGWEIVMAVGDDARRAVSEAVRLESLTDATGRLIPTNSVAASLITDADLRGTNIRSGLSQLQGMVDSSLQKESVSQNGSPTKASPSSKDPFAGGATFFDTWNDDGPPSNHTSPSKTASIFQQEFLHGRPDGNDQTADIEPDVFAKGGPTSPHSGQEWFTQVTGGVAPEPMGSVGPELVSAMGPSFANPPVDPVRTLLYINRERRLVSFAVPSDADRWHSLKCLEDLNARSNLLTHIPPSLFRAPQLRRVNLDRNRLVSLPTSIGEASRLEELSVRYNMLTTLPVELCRCARLRRLCVDYNQLKELPKDIGLVGGSLEWVSIEENKLQRIPLSVSSLTSLKDLKLRGNPIEFPSREIVGRGVAAIRWACRQASLVYSRGAPPQLAMVASGIQAERLSPEGDVAATVLEKIQLAAAGMTRGVLLNHAFADLHSIPSHILEPLWRCDGLTALSLESCGLKALPEALGRLSSLTALSVRDNSIVQLSPSVVGSLLDLRALNLSRNDLSRLPPQFLLLTRLTALDLSNNDVDRLPSALPTALPCLRVVDVSHNRLQQLPACLGSATSLEALNVSHNKLTHLPWTVGACVSLRVLIASGNRLGRFHQGCGVPASIALIPDLRALHLSGNMLRRLPQAFGAEGSSMCTSLRVLFLDGNDLPEVGDLPLRLSALETLWLQGNPRLRSPPSHVLSSGIDVIRSYCARRLERMEEIRSSLGRLGLEMFSHHMAPVAGWSDRLGAGVSRSQLGVTLQRGEAVRDAVLLGLRAMGARGISDREGSLRYRWRGHVTSHVGEDTELLQEDLVAIDAATDALCNGDFESVHADTASLVALVESLLGRRRFGYLQSQVFSFQDVLDVAFQQSILPDTHIEDMVRRPWGEDGEMVSCWGIDLDAIYGAELVPAGVKIGWKDPVRYPLTTILKGGPRRMRQKEREGCVLWPINGKELDSYWEARHAADLLERATKRNAAQTAADEAAAAVKDRHSTDVDATVDKDHHPSDVKGPVGEEESAGKVEEARDASEASLTHAGPKPTWQTSYPPHAPPTMPAERAPGFPRGDATHWSTKVSFDASELQESEGEAEFPTDVVSSVVLSHSRAWKALPLAALASRPVNEVAAMFRDMPRPAEPSHVTSTLLPEDVAAIRAGCFPPPRPSLALLFLRPPLSVEGGDWAFGTGGGSAFSFDADSMGGIAGFNQYEALDRVQRERTEPLTSEAIEGMRPHMRAREEQMKQLSAPPRDTALLPRVMPVKREVHHASGGQRADQRYGVESGHAFDEQTHIMFRKVSRKADAAKRREARLRRRALKREAAKEELEAEDVGRTVPADEDALVSVTMRAVHRQRVSEAREALRLKTAMAATTTRATGGGLDRDSTASSDESVSSGFEDWWGHGHNAARRRDSDEEDGECPDDATDRTGSEVSDASSLTLSAPEEDEAFGGDAVASAKLYAASIPKELWELGQHAVGREIDHEEEEEEAEPPVRRRRRSSLMAGAMRSNDWFFADVETLEQLLLGDAPPERPPLRDVIHNPNSLNALARLRMDLLPREQPDGPTSNGRPERWQFNPRHKYYRRPDWRVRDGKIVDMNSPVEAAKRRASRRHAVPLVTRTRFDLPRKQLTHVLQAFQGPYGPVAELEAAVAFVDCPCDVIAERLSCRVKQLCAYRSRKRGGMLVWGPLPQEMTAELSDRREFEAFQADRMQQQISGPLAGESDVRKAWDAEKRKRQVARRKAQREAIKEVREKLLRAREDARAHGLDEHAAVAAAMAGADLERLDEMSASKDDADRSKQADAILARIEAESRALEAAAVYKASGQLPGEEDDIGTKVKWPRRDDLGRWVRVARGGENGIGRHLPKCIRPSIVVQQRTLSRLDATRKQNEVKEVLALGQRLIGMMRQWAMSAAGRRAIELEAESRRSNSLVELSGQIRRCDVLKIRSETAETAARTAAAHVNDLREKVQLLKESAAFDKNAEEELEREEERFKSLVRDLQYCRERLVRGENKKAALQEKSRRPLSQWRLTVLKALEKRQRRKALLLVLEKNRRRAYRNGWRRLWDGDGGEDFKAWGEDLLEHRPSLAMQLLKRAESNVEDPEGWGGDAGGTVSERVRLIMDRAKTGARDAFEVDMSGEGLLTEVLESMLKRKIKQERQRRRAVGMVQSDSSEEEEEEEEDEEAPEHEGEGGDPDAENDGPEPVYEPPRVRPLVVEGITLDTNERKRKKQLKDLAKQTGRTPEDLLTQARNDARAAALAEAEEFKARHAMWMEKKKKNGGQSVGTMKKPRKGERGGGVQSGDVPNHPAGRYVDEGLGKDDMHEYVGGEREPDTVMQEGVTGIVASGGGSHGNRKGKKLADTGGLREDVDNAQDDVLRLAADKLAAEVRAEEAEEEAARDVEGDLASDLLKGEKKKTRRIIPPADDGSASVAGEIEKSLAKANARAEEAIQEAALAAVRGRISQAEALRIAFNVSAGIGVDRHADKDGGPLGLSVEKELRGEGILRGPLAPQRRYSFASESSVDYDGREEDLADMERAREERMLRIRESAVKAATTSEPAREPTEEEKVRAMLEGGETAREPKSAVAEALASLTQDKHE